MKKIKNINQIAIGLLIALAGTHPVFGKTINITVNGVVCAFCAQGITKKFKSEAAVKDIRVDLDKKIVKLETNDGQEISDETITKDITDAGFNVVSIKRDPL